MQGIWCHWRRGNIGGLSVTDIKGSAASGNRGLADLLLFKYQMKPVLIAKATGVFPDTANWWPNVVGKVAEWQRTRFDAEESTNKAWRAGRAMQEGKLLSFFRDVVCEKLHDPVIQTAVKSSKSPADALQMPGLVEFLVELEEKVASQRQPTAMEAEPHSLPKATNTDDDDIAFLLPSNDGNTPPVCESQLYEGWNQTRNAGQHHHKHLATSEGTHHLDLSRAG